MNFPSSYSGMTPPTPEAAALELDRSIDQQATAYEDKAKWAANVDRADLAHALNLEGKALRASHEVAQRDRIASATGYMRDQDEDDVRSAKWALEDARERMAEIDRRRDEVSPELREEAKAVMDGADMTEGPMGREWGERWAAIDSDIVSPDLREAYSRATMFESDSYEQAMREKLHAHDPDTFHDLHPNYYDSDDGEPSIADENASISAYVRQEWNAVPEADRRQVEEAMGGVRDYVKESRQAQADQPAQGEAVSPTEAERILADLNFRPTERLDDYRSDDWRQSVAKAEDAGEDDLADAFEAVAQRDLHQQSADDYAEASLRARAEGNHGRADLCDERAAGHRDAQEWAQGKLDRNPRAADAEEVAQGWKHRQGQGQGDGQGQGEGEGQRPRFTRAEARQKRDGEGGEGQGGVPAPTPHEPHKGGPAPQQGGAAEGPRFTRGEAREKRDTEAAGQTWTPKPRGGNVEVSDAEMNRRQQTAQQQAAKPAASVTPSLPGQDEQKKKGMSR